MRPLRHTVAIKVGKRSDRQVLESVRKDSQSGKSFCTTCWKSATGFRTLGLTAGLRSV